MFDDIVIGGLFSGVSKSSILNSEKYKYSAVDKKTGFLTHQKTSTLPEATFKNAFFSSFEN